MSSAKGAGRVTAQVMVTVDERHRGQSTAVAGRLEAVGMSVAETFALGGVIVGVGGLIVPQALGVGYNVIESELNGTITLDLIVGILVVKTLIWSLSLGSGTSGGVLAPMIMIGGALGGLEATVFPHVGPGFWPLVGLAGVLGGVSGGKRGGGLL